MSKDRPYISILATLFIMALLGCAGSYTIQVVDEETKASISGIDVEIIDEDAEEILISGTTGAGGSFKFRVADIPGDSFYILVDGDQYFEYKAVFYKTNRGDKVTVPLALRTTVIEGRVLEDSTYAVIPDCEIETVPISATTRTDDKGKFVLKSNDFANMRYTIFAKHPNYLESSATITPKINERNSLEMIIFLKLIEQPGFNDTLPPVTPIGIEKPVH